MKKTGIAAIALLVVMPFAAFAIEIPMSDSARLDITSRTSFGFDLDETFRFGLSNELTQLDLVFGLAPYQKISNRLNTPDAVGFINVTLFHLDLIKVTPQLGYNPPAGIGTNRYQTGEFLAGIVKGNWLVQLNAGGNEPFSSPWNKGLEFINDGFKFSWAYLHTMVDIRRVNAISGVPVVTKRGIENLEGDGQTAAHETMKQFGFDAVGNIADRFGPSFGGQMVAVMYNADSFGINTKIATQYAFDSSNITKSNKNGFAAGVDTVFMPEFLPGLKVFASVLTTQGYSFDEDPDPLVGGTRVGYTVPLTEDISFEPWVGFDIGTKFKDKGGNEKPEYEFSIGGTMRWPGQGGWLKDYIVNSDGRVFPGMSFGYKIYENTETETGVEHSVNFTLFEPRGDEGVFYKVGSEIIVDVIDLTNATAPGEPGNTLIPSDKTGRDPAWRGFTILATVYFDYELGKIGKIPGSFVPWTILYYDNLPGATKDDDRINDFKIDIGVNLENAVANTTFGFVWNTGSLIQEAARRWGTIRLTAEIKL